MLLGYAAHRENAVGAPRGDRQIVAQKRSLRWIGPSLGGIQAHVSASVPKEPELNCAGLPIGSQAPRFDLPDLAGRSVSLTSRLAYGHPVLVVFADLAQADGQGLLTRLANRGSASPVTRVVIGVGIVPDGVRSVSSGARLTILQRGLQTAEEYRLCAIPSAVVIGFNGHIATKPAVGSRPIVELLSQMVTDLPSPARSTL